MVLLLTSSVTVQELQAANIRKYDNLKALDISVPLLQPPPGGTPNEVNHKTIKQVLV